MNYFLILFALMSNAAAFAAPSLSPANVAASIAAKGAKHTIDDLVRAGQWEAVTNAMDRGSGAWIALAPKLVPGSDAGSAEDLGLSLAFALPLNAHAVLAALDPKNGHILGAQHVCGRPFIEDTEPSSYKKRALAALNRVLDRRLVTAKLNCIAALRASR